jgi:pilus assembly protein FimV
MLACLTLKNHKGAVVRDTNLKTWLVALLIALLPCVAGAAGLGRITVLTAIGQPLIAEVELVAVTPQELASLSARLALPDTYRQANLQYNSALAGARLTVEKRPDGQPFLKIATTRAVTEPFIDLLVELTWSAGRLSREYTALLDPPGIPPAPSAPVISAAPKLAPAPAPKPAPQPPVTVAPQAPVTIEPQPPVTVEPRAPVAPVAVAPVISKPVVAAPMAASKEYGPIERGETLGKIARSVMPEGVTLEQMLVALYRTNPDAFIRQNLNLVRTGKILRVPDRDEVETTVARDDAVAEYRTHVAGGTPIARSSPRRRGPFPRKGAPRPGQESTKSGQDKLGKPKDVVKLSKGEPAGAAAGKGKPRSNAERIRMLEEEVVSREKALAEANSRITHREDHQGHAEAGRAEAAGGCSEASAAGSRSEAGGEACSAAGAREETGSGCGCEAGTRCRADAPASARGTAKTEACPCAAEARARADGRDHGDGERSALPWRGRRHRARRAGVLDGAPAPHGGESKR